MRGADTKAFLDVREDRVPPLLLVRLGDALEEALGHLVLLGKVVFLRHLSREEEDHAQLARLLKVLVRAGEELDHQAAVRSHRNLATDAELGGKGGRGHTLHLQANSQRARRRRRGGRRGCAGAAAGGRVLLLASCTARAARRRWLLLIADERHELLGALAPLEGARGSGLEVVAALGVLRVHATSTETSRGGGGTAGRTDRGGGLERLCKGAVLLTQPAPVDEAGGREGSGPRGLAASLEVPTGGVRHQRAEEADVAAEGVTRLCGPQ